MNLTKKKSKRIEDELKKKEQEKETAKIFEEFVASFEGTPSTSKAFVRGNTIDPETRVERSDGKTGKLYKPTSKIAESVYAKQQRAIEEAQKARAESHAISQKAKLKKEKEREKQKKSNLELFKEELRVLQLEREERHKQRKARGSDTDYDEPILPTPQPTSVGSASDIRLPAGIEEYSYGSHDYGDPNTTNIFLGSINPKMNEEMLCKEFVQYGPLASVKIMWPRTDAERQRNRNCGFVAFMNRRDAERAMRALNGKEIMNYEMKLGWGKAVVLPPHPVYIPEAMIELTMPPPPSGLPFNSQLKKSSKRDIPNLPPPGIQLTMEEEGELEETLKEAVVKVVIPTERPLLQVIHRMIEFVVNEGPMFEAMVMNREINNPMFRFLFDNQTPAHVYYRWKLFSILQGDSITKWSTDEFCMFKDGSVWRPPPINPYQQGMPDALAPKHAITKALQPEPEQLPKKKILTNHQRDKLEDMLRAITMDRYKIGEAMMYCLDHAESAEEIVECIAESLALPETPLPKKMGRLFLVSDILFNSSSKVSNASFFRKFFENHLPVIMQDVRETYSGIQQRLKAEQFKQRVMACFRSWEDWAVYPNEFLVRLQNIFLGFLDHDTVKEEFQIKDPEALAQPEVDLDGVPVDEVKKEKVDPVDFDGVPMEDELDLDGAPLLVEAAEELDGAPIDGDPIDGAPMQEDHDDQQSFTSSGGLKLDDKEFKVAPSKWETVDSSLLEAQAMTTSKWETLAEDEEEQEEGQEEQNEEDEMEDREENDEDGEDNVQSLVTDLYKSSEMVKMKRAKLREIELKVMKFQDDVESGRRSRKKDMTMLEQVERYRHKLMQKEKDKEAERQRSKNKDRERDRLKEFERAREKERERFSKELDGSSGEEEVMPVVSSSRRDRDRKRRRSRSRSSSPGKQNFSRSPSSRRSNSRKVSPDSLSVLREYSDSPSSRSHRSGSRSPPVRLTPSHRTRSPKKSRRSRSRSRSPRRRRSPSPSSRKSQRSRSRSPHRRSSSHKKKSKH